MQSRATNRQLELEGRLAVLTSRLNEQELQLARMGNDAPAHLRADLDDTKTQIAVTRGELAQIYAAHHPDLVPRDIGGIFERFVELRTDVLSTFGGLWPWLRTIEGTQSKQGVALQGLIDTQARELEDRPKRQQQVDEALLASERRLDAGFKAVDGQFKKVDARLDRIEHGLWRFWIAGMLVGALLAIIVLVVVVRTWG